MKAIMYHAYGAPDVLQLKEIAKPVVNDDDVLIRVHAASINPLEWHFMRGKPYLVRALTGLRKPKNARLGIDVAGVVEAVGSNVTQFKVGDEVFGGSRGALAEYTCAREAGIVLKPANLTFTQAAAVATAALTALQGLRDAGRIKSGQKVLVNGAAGGVGTFAVQIAKSFGARVSGVCSTRNVDMVRSIGADDVIDYTRQDYTRSAQRYDLILDIVGNHSLSANRRLLETKGTLVGVGGTVGNWIGPLVSALTPLVVSWFVSQRLASHLTKSNKDDLVFLQELLAAGTVVPVIDRTWPLSEIADAIRYLEQGHARGKVVITMPATA